MSVVAIVAVAVEAVVGVALTAARGGRVDVLEVNLVLIFLYKQPKRHSLMLLKKKIKII